jgi:hypothetical protein
VRLPAPPEQPVTRRVALNAKSGEVDKPGRNIRGTS